MYRVYVENKVIVFTSAASAAADTARISVVPGEGLTLTKLLQKVQFTKRLEVISAQTPRVFGEFSRTLPMIEAGGGLVLDERQRVLMIFRNGRWDLPKGKREKGEEIRACALREVEEECSVSGLRCEQLLTHTYHCYQMGSRWVLKRTAWFLMRGSGSQQPVPQTIEGITDARWVPGDELPGKLSGTYRTILDVFEASGRYGNIPGLDE